VLVESRRSLIQLIVVAIIKLEGSTARNNKVGVRVWRNISGSKLVTFQYVKIYNASSLSEHHILHGISENYIWKLTDNLIGSLLFDAHLTEKGTKHYLFLEAVEWFELEVQVGLIHFFVQLIYIFLDINQ